jgi:hypothetical protein
LARIAPIICGLSSRPAAKAIVVIGRAAALGGEHRATWEAMRREVQSSRLTVAWFDLGANGCPETVFPNHGRSKPCLAARRPAPVRSADKRVEYTRHAASASARLQP